MSGISEILSRTNLTPRHRADFYEKRDRFGKIYKKIDGGLRISHQPRNLGRWFRQNFWVDQLLDRKILKVGEFGKSWVDDFGKSWVYHFGKSWVVDLYGWWLIRTPFKYTKKSTIIFLHALSFTPMSKKISPYISAGLLFFYDSSIYLTDSFLFYYPNRTKIKLKYIKKYLYTYIIILSPMGRKNDGKVWQRERILRIVLWWW